MNRAKHQQIASDEENLSGRGQWLDLPKEAQAFSLGDVEKTSKAIKATGRRSLHGFSLF